MPTIDLTQNLEQASAHLNSSLKDFQEGKGPIGKATKDLNRMTKKFDGILEKADSTLADVENGKGTLGKLLKDDKLYDELTLTMKKVNKAFAEFESMKGQFSSLVNETETTVKEAKHMVASIKQNSDAVKSMPIVRSFIVDINKELNRPSFKRHRLYFEEERLFEPGKAVLTDSGKRILDAAAQWAVDRKDEGSEMVVAAFADPKYPSGFAKTLTEKQSETVVEYLKENHKVHRMGFWWWSNRRVKALGCGNAPTPVPEKEKLPAARIEIIIFVPQNS